MSYAKPQDLEVAFGQAEILQLSDRDSDGDPDANVLERALATADGEINSYLSVRYAIPLPLVPQIVRDKACDIARYRLQDDTPTDEARQRYEDAIEWLKSVAAGRALLVGIPVIGSAAATPTVGRVRTGQAASNFDWGTHGP